MVKHSLIIVRFYPGVQRQMSSVFVQKQKKNKTKKRKLGFGISIATSFSIAVCCLYMARDNCLWCGALVRGEYADYHKVGESCLL